MSEEQRFGDGQDNYLQGMRQAAEAARQFGSAAGGAGAAGAAGSAAGEAAANAAAATVKAGVEAGKAVSGIAAGTAVGGPWGAVLSAAWSLRHTLFKILIFICLFLLFIIIAVVSLPSIVFNNIFHTDPSTVDPNGPTEVSANFDDLSAVVSDCIQAGYDAALARVDQIIADGGYPATYPSQIFFLKEDIGYEIVVLYDGEQHLARLLQPQEDLRYIFVLPHIRMAQELVLPSVPCLFATVDYNGQEVPDVRFYTESEGGRDGAV